MFFFLIALKFMTFLMFRINNDVKMINKLIVKALGF